MTGDIKKIILVAATINLLAINTISGQGSIDFFQDSDVEKINVQPNFNPNIVAHGGFDTYYYNHRGKSLSGDYGIDTKVKFYLNLKTTIYDDSSFVLQIQNKDFASTNEANGYRYYSDEELKSEGRDRLSDAQDLQAELYYLNYIHNPSAKFLIGRQEMSIGDRQGIVYQGTGFAITQSCAVGSWCYYIGVANIGIKNGGFRFFHLNYPVYDQEQEIETLWDEKIAKNRLDIEAYNIYYTDYHLPLAMYGGTTMRPKYGDATSYSSYQRQDDGYINRDSRWQYWGLNIDWQRYPVRILLNYLQLAGYSLFYRETTPEVNSYIKQNQNSGQALLLNGWYYPTDKFNVNLTYFSSSGNSYPQDSTEAISPHKMDSEDKAFYEVNKGTYQVGSIYFGDGSGFGEAHSISNLTYYNITFSYKNQRKTFGLDIDFYDFHRTEDIFNSQSKRVKKIGNEIDVTMNFKLTNGLDFNLVAAHFSPNEAYSKNDNIVPEGDIVDSFSQLGFNVSYKF